MKLYYFVHGIKGGEMEVEVFASAMKAKRRLAELRLKAKIVAKQLQDWIIDGKRGQRPSDPMILPSGIEHISVDTRGKDGVMAVFQRGLVIGRRMRDGK